MPNKLIYSYLLMNCLMEECCVAGATVHQVAVAQAAQIGPGNRRLYIYILPWKKKFH